MVLGKLRDTTLTVIVRALKAVGRIIVTVVKTKEPSHEEEK
jgi:hypothetical protein